MTAAERLATPAFIALAAATLAFFVAGGVVLPVAPRFAEGPLGGTASEVGIAIAAFSIAALVMRPVVGWATDRFGRRPSLVLGSAITIAALLLHLVAQSLPVFVAARSLLGAGEAFFFVAATAAASDLAPARRRGEAISFFSLSIYLGVAVGPLIGESLLGEGGYGAVWLAAAVIALLALGLAWFTPETAAPPPSDGSPRPRARLFHPAGLFPGFLILCGVWGMGGFFAFVPLYVDQVGLDTASLPLAVFALVVVGLRIVGAKWPDRFGAARLSGTALALSAVGLAVIGLAPSMAGLLVGTAAFAAGVAFTFPALLALAVSRVGPDERGTVVGTASVFLDVSFGIAPVVLGAIAQAADYGATFLVSAGFSALGSILLAVRRASVAAPVAERPAEAG